MSYLKEKRALLEAREAEKMQPRRPYVQEHFRKYAETLNSNHAKRVAEELLECLAHVTAKIHKLDYAAFAKDSPLREDSPLRKRLQAITADTVTEGNAALENDLHRAITDLKEYIDTQPGELPPKLMEDFGALNKTLLAHVEQLKTSMVTAKRCGLFTEGVSLKASRNPTAAARG